jgi:polysaccharide export outer membrane protein
MSRVFVCIGWVAIVLSLSGCLARDDFRPVAAAQPVFQGPQLKPGDVLNIAIAGEDELDGQYVVEPDGTVALPLIGSVTANGDVAAFQAKLRQQLMQGFLKNPAVTVTLAANTSVAAMPQPPGIRQTDSATGSY